MAYLRQVPFLVLQLFSRQQDQLKNPNFPSPLFTEFKAISRLQLTPTFPISNHHWSNRFVLVEISNPSSSISFFRCLRVFLCLKVLQWRRTGVRRVITVRRTKEPKITGAEGTTRFGLVTLSRMGAMWCRASLVGVIFPLFGSLGTLTNRCVHFCLFPHSTTWGC